MTTDLSVSFAAILLSLLASYLPGFSTWFNAKTPDTRRLIMLAALLIVVAGAYGYSCAGQATYFICNSQGAWEAAKLFILALVANQSVYAISPQTAETKTVREAKDISAPIGAVTYTNYYPPATADTLSASSGLATPKTDNSPTVPLVGG